MIFVPAAFFHASAVEMAAFDPHDLQAAQEREPNHDA
jgi:hypothetical protein